MDINKTEPGVQLNILIEKHVFGNEVYYNELDGDIVTIHDDDGPPFVHPPGYSLKMGGTSTHGIASGFVFAIRVPSYSTDIAAALDVVEALTDKDKYEPEIIEIRGPWHDGWAARLVWRHHDGDIPMTEWADAETLPLAICRLALIRKTKEWVAG